MGNEAFKSAKEQSRLKIVMRWIAFLPASFLVAWVAWILVTFGNKISMRAADIDPDSFISRLCIELTSNAIMGFTFVYTGLKIAPSHRRVVAYALVGLSFVIVGSMIVLSYASMRPDPWVIWASVCFIFGAGYTVYSINIGEVFVE